MNIHIPTYEEVCDKHPDTRTAMDDFVVSYEPPDEEDVPGFRADLHSLIEYVLRKEDK